MGGDGNNPQRRDRTMNTTSTDRDAQLGVVYRELATAELELTSAQGVLADLGWTTAAGDLADARATVRDLLHDLAVYAGSTGAEL
jgi:hypothetical protein